jgi:hypothetical protein
MELVYTRISFKVCSVVDGSAFRVTVPRLHQHCRFFFVKKDHKYMPAHSWRFFRLTHFELEYFGTPLIAEFEL